MTDRQAIQKFLTRVSDQIKKEQRDKGITASGESAGSLRSEIDEKQDIEGRLYGRKYFRNQEEGTTAEEYKAIPYPEHYKQIRQWLNTKGFSRGLTDRRKQRLAAAITAKQRIRGSKRGRSKEFPGLNLTAIVRSNLDELRGNIRGNAISGVRSRILRTINEN